MARENSTAATATAPAVAATQQSRDRNPVTNGAGAAAVLRAAAPAPEAFELGDGLDRALVAPYQRKPDDPLYRPLKIYSVDPSMPKLDGAVVTVNVPYEPLAPGPIGALFEVDSCDGERDIRYRAADLNAMSLGDETASSLGIPIARFRLSVFVAGALITGVMVAFSGIIGFVGLMMPHLVRLIVGGDNARVLPLSALFGAIFLTWADTTARIVMAPEDMPIGIVTGLVGGLFFVWLMARRT